jgi:hypothetical protein
MFVNTFCIHSRDSDIGAELCTPKTLLNVPGAKLGDIPFIFFFFPSREAE